MPSPLSVEVLVQELGELSSHFSKDTAVGRSPALKAADEAFETCITELRELIASEPGQQPERARHAFLRARSLMSRARDLLETAHRERWRATKAREHSAQLRSGSDPSRSPGER